MLKTPIVDIITNFRANKQSGTKPKLVVKIQATNFGVFFVIYVMFSKNVQYDSNHNRIKYSGSGIPHNWDVSFRKFGGLPTVVTFQEN